MYFFNRLQVPCREKWVMSQLQLTNQDLTTFESDDSWPVVSSLSIESDQTTPTQSCLADSLLNF